MKIIVKASACRLLLIVSTREMLLARKAAKCPAFVDFIRLKSIDKQKLCNSNACKNCWPSSTIVSIDSPVPNNDNVEGPDEVGGMS